MKISVLIFCASVVIWLSSCETRLSNEDGNRPEVLCSVVASNFSFSCISSHSTCSTRSTGDTSIRGNHQTVYLNPVNTQDTVTITVIASDRGGVRRCGILIGYQGEQPYEVLETPAGVVSYDIPPSGPTVLDKNVYYQLNGNPRSPLTGLYFTMKIRLNENLQHDVSDLSPGLQIAGYGFDYRETADTMGYGYFLRPLLIFQGEPR